jgi:two-component system sensor histidine kinase KdpD
MTNKAALAPEIDDGLGAALRQIQDLFRVRTALLLRADDHKLGQTAHAAGSFQPDERGRSVAAWAFEKNQPAGRFTDTLPDSPTLWLPLRARTAVMGAMGVLAEPDRTLTLDERDWLENFALQIGSVLEKDHFIQAFRRAEVSEASERLRKTLLDSVSHELKTPLWALEAAVKGIADQPADARRFLPELRTALRRLWRTVHNLLDMSRLESGSVKPSAAWCDVTELCDNALDLVGESLDAHRLSVEIPGGLPLVKADQALLEQALANLLLNAAAHTPPGTDVTLRAGVSDGALRVEVLDNGPGLPEGDPDALFEKFRRGEGARAGGTGLGLAIARGFLRAQHGDVTARRRDGGGAAFSIRLPTETMAVEAART